MRAFGCVLPVVAAVTTLAFASPVDRTEKSLSGENELSAPGDNDLVTAPLANFTADMAGEEGQNGFATIITFDDWHATNVGAVTGKELEEAFYQTIEYLCPAHGTGPNCFEDRWTWREPMWFGPIAYDPKLGDKGQEYITIQLENAFWRWPGYNPELIKLAIRQMAGSLGIISTLDQNCYTADVRLQGPTRLCKIPHNVDIQFISGWNTHHRLDLRISASIKFTGHTNKEHLDCDYSLGHIYHYWENNIRPEIVSKGGIPVQDINYRAHCKMREAGNSPQIPHWGPPSRPPK